jgi:glucokinase
VLGEWVAGAARGDTRCAGLTLGTGVGSGWVADGRIVDSGPDVPPGGRAHRLEVDGVPLEDVMSRRAIRRAYATRTLDEQADVREIAERARGGDPVASDVLSRAVRALGAALGPYVRRFEAQVLVIGGSMAAYWDLFEPWFVTGFGDHAPKIVTAADAEHSPLYGAAWYALGSPDPDEDPR